jgi:hypothetical protein
MQFTSIGRHDIQQTTLNNTHQTDYQHNNKNTKLSIVTVDAERCYGVSLFIVTLSVIPLNVVAPKILLSTCRLKLIVQYTPS